MKQRSLPKMFFLFVITLGIYRLYWLLKTRSEMMRSNHEIKIMSPLVLIAPFLLLAVSVAAMIWSGATNGSARSHYYPASQGYCTTAQEVSALCPEPDATDTFEPSAWSIVLFYLACFSFLPLQALWMWNYSHGVEKITKDKLSFPIAMLVLLVVPDGFDILIVQESFNKLHPAAA